VRASETICAIVEAEISDGSDDEHPKTHMWQQVLSVLAAEVGGAS
jgi:hypothetical protein